MKGCSKKFSYLDEKQGFLVLRCGVWTSINKINSHQILKYCYDCLDDDYEKELIRKSEETRT